MEVVVGAGSSATQASCQNDESNTAIEREIASSLRQQSKNSSNVTTPSPFISIFCERNETQKKKIINSIGKTEMRNRTDGKHFNAEILFNESTWGQQQSQDIDTVRMMCDGPL